MMIDGQTVRLKVAHRVRLYSVSLDNHNKEEHTQLSVPKSCQEIIFQVAHYNLMAGHMGYDKTALWFASSSAGSQVLSQIPGGMCPRRGAMFTEGKVGATVEERGRVCSEGRSRGNNTDRAWLAKLIDGGMQGMVCGLAAG